jgi:hypothetical protein
MSLLVDAALLLMLMLTMLLLLMLLLLLMFAFGVTSADQCHHRRYIEDVGHLHDVLAKQRRPPRLPSHHSAARRPRTSPIGAGRTPSRFVQVVALVQHKA